MVILEIRAHVRRTLARLVYQKGVLLSVDDLVRYAIRIFERALSQQSAEARRAIEQEIGGDFNTYVAEVAAETAKEFHTTFDPAKRKRPLPRSRRPERRTRDDDIVAEYRQNPGTSRALAERLGFSKNMVQRALSKAGIAPGRQEIIRRMTPEAQVLASALTKIAPNQTIFVVGRDNAEALIKYKCDNTLNDRQLNGVIEEINSARIGLQLIYDSLNLTVSVGRKRTVAQFEKFDFRKKKSQTGRFILGLHQILVDESECSRIGNIFMCLRGLYDRSAGIVVEQLLRLSFRFYDFDRVRSVVRRALISEWGLEELPSYAFYEHGEDYKKIIRANKAIRYCIRAMDDYDYITALRYWVEQTDLKAELTGEELKALEHIESRIDLQDQPEQIQKELAAFLSGNPKA